jgi:Flp pilus assembly CpaE family ATPase
VRGGAPVTIAVITAADGALWEASLLSELSRSSDADSIVVVRRCVDVVELLAVAGSGQAVAALVDAQLRRFDADAVDRLDACGVAVIGVTAPETAADTERLNAAGVKFCVPSDSPTAVFAGVVHSAVAEAAGTPSVGTAFADPTFATGALTRGAAREPVSAGEPGVLTGKAGGSTSPRGGSTRLAGRSADPGGRVAGEAGGAVDQPATVITVWGPTGAPGRTTTAMAVADELARLGQSCLLVDADVYGGVVAPLFGLLDESPGLVAACRQAQSRRLDIDSLAGLCWQLSPQLRVLTGISRADRWPEVRSTALQSVLSTARGLADFTVVDVGFALETDEELSFDTLAPRRNGATLAALQEADLVLAIGSADPIGMQRLVRGLDELRAAEIQTPVWIVLNRVRRGPVPGNVEAELNAALQRFAGRPSAALLPYDLAGLDAAAAAGQTLAEAAPASPLRRAVIDLARAMSGVPAPASGRRRK